jgi:hypothetical protein
MRRWVLVPLNIVAALAITVWTLDTSLAQKNDQRRSSKSSVVEALHPDPVESDPPPGIKLLTGYKHKSGTDFEGNQVGEIFKPDGVKVKYEIGLSQGMAIEKQQRHRYLWFREQVVNKRTIRYALDKENSLIISVALDDDPDSLHAANFVGTIKKPEDLGDMLLMILPFTFKQTSDR